MNHRVKAAAVTLAATTASLGVAGAIVHVARLNPGLLVVAAALGLSMGRERRDEDWPDRLTALTVLPIAAAAAVVTHALLAGPYAVLGAALFVLAMSATVYVRRWGGRATAAGAQASMPLLVVVLVAPVGMPDLGWTALIALVTCGVVLAIHLLTGPPPPRRADGSPRGRLPASTKMAIQLGVALSLAFVCGRLVLGEHWQWMVLTTFLVFSGNRGRADVVYKGILRVAGAAVGTGGATLLLPLLAGGPAAQLAAICAVLVAGVWLRPFNYAYWAASITAALAFTSAYFGQSVASMLTVRLAGILLGGAVAIAVSWYVLPVRSTAVARLRVAESVRALAALLQSLQEGGADERLPEHRARFEQAVGRVAEIAPPFEARRRLLGRWRAGARRHADVFDTLRDSARSLRRITEHVEASPGARPEPGMAALIGQARKELGALRTDGADLHATLRRTSEHLAETAAPRSQPPCTTRPSGSP
ncbi:Fusaric acid resistance protein family protein [Nonomuraea solani]|uniref:Fusaric acid resistance protein family protein n=1 Tax=Nonomuraea solani TaxID=1144553 RepID=A0A1H6EWF9_9ACTN|nr:FUSC family protein [Nonomuraea solani]SEH01004.1 Fusaric acid resistance protein family protein [Nonomuraea solani]